MSIQFLKTESMNGTLVHRHTKHSFQFKTPFGAMPSFAKFYPFPRKKRKEKCPCFVVFSFVDNQNDKNSWYPEEKIIPKLTWNLNEQWMKLEHHLIFPFLWREHLNESWIERFKIYLFMQARKYPLTTWKPYLFTE